jgi:hypothetical protein
LETLEKHSAYLKGYSEGMWSMWRGKQLAFSLILVIVVLSWIIITSYMTITGAC